MSKKLVFRLYKSLLVVAKRFDKEPKAKILFYRKYLTNIALDADDTPPIDEIKRKRHHGASDAKRFYDNLTSKLFLDNSYLYQPSVTTGSLSELVVSAFRKPELYELDHNYAHKPASIQCKLDAAFAALRRLSGVWKTYLDIRKNIDLNRFAKLSGEITSVKLTSTIEPGTILISHPLVHGVLHRSVILVIESNDKGSYGLIINKFTDNTVNDSVRNLPDKVHRVFGGYKVFYGGMVRRLQYLHNFPNCGGIPIPNCSNNSLFIGGQINKVLSALDQENPQPNPSPTNVKIFVGCCTWDVGKLDREYQAGYWIPVTSRLDECLKVDNTNDLWSILLNKLDAPYSDMAGIPASIEASVVDNIDYDLH